MQLPPEAIDAAVIQLRGLIHTTEGIPDKVIESGDKFINDLDEWSEALKKAKQS